MYSERRTRRRRQAKRRHRRRRGEWLRLEPGERSVFSHFRTSLEVSV